MQNQPQSVPDNWARRFFTIWAGQAFSLFGSALVQFALVWWLAQESGSATVLTLAMLAGLLPQIVLGPFAGALVDRGNRRLIMIAADAMIALATLVLLYLFMTDQAQVWHVYAIMAIRSLGGAFHFPAMAASTPLMVPKEQLTRINGLNQTLQGLNTIVAPPVGALLISAFSTESVLIIDIVTAALAILPLLFIPIPQPERKSEDAGAKQSLFQDVRDGLAYLRAWPGLVAILGMALIINGFLNPASALMPLLVTKYFGKGVLELGFIDTAFGIGMIAGGVILSTWGGFKRKVATAMLGITGIGVGIMLVAVAPPHLFLLALAGMAFAGIMNPIANGSLFAIVQTVIAPEMQGRIMSLIMTFATAITPISLLAAGPVSDSIGIRAWFWIGGIVTILMGVGGFFSRAVMTVEDNHKKGTTETQPVVAVTD